MITAGNSRTQASGATDFDQSRSAAEAATGHVGMEPREWISIRHPLWSMSQIVARSTIASMFGLGAAVLAILRLVGVASPYMLPVAGIVLASAFLAFATIDVAWGRMFGFLEHDTLRDRYVYFSGLAAVLVAGVTALVLSILYLAFPADLRFAAVAAIALGGGLFWHSGIMREVSCLTHDVAYHGVAGPRPRGPFSLNLLSIAPVRDALVGLGGVVLGILAILSIVPAILCLVAFLVNGAALTFSAATMCGASMVTLREVCTKGSGDSANFAAAT